MSKSPPVRGVRYAKSLSIQYFINIDLLQNSLIDINIDKDISKNVLIDIFQNVIIDIDTEINISRMALSISIAVFSRMVISISIFSKSVDILIIDMAYRYIKHPC